jgi:hypothetical protein
VAAEYIRGAGRRRDASNSSLEIAAKHISGPDADQRTATARRPTLDGPIIIDRWWKNRAHDALYVRLAPYEGQSLLDIRVWITGSDGITKPTKGLSCRVKHLPRLHAALTLALAKARELGLLDDDDSGGKS